jgi:hypothetical protein
MVKTSVQYIKEAAKKLVDSKLQRLGSAKTQEIFKGVMQTVGLESLEEVYLFVAQFDLTCRDRTSNMDDLSSYFLCSSLDLIEYIPALKALEQKGLLVRRGRREENIFKQNFAVNDTVMVAIIENQSVEISHVVVDEKQIDKYEYCKRIAEKVEDDDVVTDDLVLFVEKLENNNSHLTFVNELKKDVTDIIDRILFYDMCYDNFNKDGEGSSDIGATLGDLLTSVSSMIRMRKSIFEGKHVLVELGLIETNEDRDRMLLTDKGKDFYYGEDIYAFVKSYKCQDIYAFMDLIYDFFHRGDNYNSSDPLIRCQYILFRAINKIEGANKHIKDVERIQRLIPNEAERVLFYFIGKNMVDDERTSLSYELKTIYTRQHRRKILAEFKDNAHHLQKLELVEIEKTSSLFGEEVNIIMTDTGKEKLLGKEAALYIDNTVLDKQLLPCDKIAEKKLFFSNELSDQLSLLSSCLDKNYYQDLCTRLKENNLPNGIAVLLYGEPGTGKTESVMQIAKATGRAIMHVDISATKTCWFGESEKLIKKVFTDYRKLCKKCKVKPILLFNEADAVFSKRKDVNIGSVAQTENAIQNIILEEMESLDGILIATTNLADNLDKAFERRFLFKIRFDKPTIEAKKNIWLTKLPSLSLDDAETLASSYDFSGGQIDNVVRKALMQEVIKGDKPTINSLIELCSEEKITKNNFKRIGFC